MSESNTIQSESEIGTGKQPTPPTLPASPTKRVKIEAKKGSVVPLNPKIPTAMDRWFDHAFIWTSRNAYPPAVGRDEFMEFHALIVQTEINPLKAENALLRTELEQLKQSIRNLERYIDNRLGILSPHD
jgi:hypothetical protein